MIPQLTLDEQQAFIRSSAPARLRRFRAATNGDRAAVSLYVLDSQISSHMHATVRVVEVALREHLHRALTKAFDERWFQSQRSLFDADLGEKIDDVLEDVGEKAPPGKVVAQLMFGAWASLLGRGGTKEDGTSAKYIANIWEPALAESFSHTAVTRKQLRSEAMSLNWARNRISHCEPVVFGFPQAGAGRPGVQLRRSPQLVLEDARTFAAHLNPGLAAWLRRWDEIDHLLNDPLLAAALDYIGAEPGVDLQRAAGTVAGSQKPKRSRAAYTSICQ